MPLSEREQQILDQLEKDLRGDPASSSHSTSRRSGERFGGLKLGILLVLVGIVMLVWFFVSSLLIAGVASFAAMVGGIVLGVSSIRSEIGRGDGARDRIARVVGGWEESVRRRYRDKD